MSPAAAQQTAPATRDAVARASARGLDWFTFFLADIQTGFGPFVAIYLTAHAWTQFDIGLVLTAGGLVALACQMPGGALVDAMRSARLVAVIAVGAICLSALALAIWPTFLVVMAARVLHAGASCVLGPVIAAISLGLVGHAALGTRLGRNARFASIGNGFAAAAMGICGYLISNQAVFFLTAALAAPAIWALGRIRLDTDRTSPQHRVAQLQREPCVKVLRDRRLLIFAGCILLFQLANAAMLPLMGGILTLRSSQWAIDLDRGLHRRAATRRGGICSMGRSRGRFVGATALVVLLLCGLGCARGAVRFRDQTLIWSLPCRSSMASAPRFSASSFHSWSPISRAARDASISGLGIVGSAVGIGAALSTSLAGYASDHFGSSIAFFSLASVAGCGLALVWLLLPETRPDAKQPKAAPWPMPS